MVKVVFASRRVMLPSKYSMAARPSAPVRIVKPSSTAWPSTARAKSDDGGRTSTMPASTRTAAVAVGAPGPATVVVSDEPPEQPTTTRTSPITRNDCARHLN
jgi:hypothetical protein